MAYICLHDKERIEGFLRKDVYLHIYSLGDLDRFFWPYTTWYGYEEDGNIEAIALVYAAPRKCMIQIIFIDMMRT
ncbi:MAG: hypothetical protein GY755_06055 [Chloroflexi bacterium]|nr:hypothetical protein [Chloroflexota bacterium]